MAKINARQKGLDYERKLVIELKELFGNDNIGTSRNLNRHMDSLKCDIVNVPVMNIQCKATETTPSYHALLKQMPNNGNYNIIFHKKNRKGEIVVMSKEDFYAFINMLKVNQII